MVLSATPVQTKKGNVGNATATSLVVTLDSTPTAGNTLIMALVMGSTAVGPLITQANVTWSTYPIYNSTGTIVLWICVGRVFASAGTSITAATLTGASMAIVLVVAEFQGTFLIRDRTASATGSSASPASGATATTSTANELWIGALANRGTWSIATTVFSSPTNSFTIVDQDNTIINTSNNDRAVALLAQVVSATGTANAGAAITSAQWAAMVLTFQEGITGTTGVKKSRLQLGQV